MSRYKRYPAYKDSGVKWLEQVPAHWDIRRLASIFEERRTKVSDKEYPALSVSKQGIVPQLDSVAKTDDGDNRRLVCKGDIAINSRSDRKGSAGLVSRDGSVSLIITVLKPLNSIRGEYAHHLIRSEAFQEEFYRVGNGLVADLWTTNYSSMREIILALPPVAEQQVIFSHLDREVSRIDTLIYKKTCFIELISEKISALAAQCLATPESEWIRLQHVVDVIKRPVTQESGEQYIKLGLLNKGRGIFKKDESDQEDMGDSDFYWVERGDLILSGQFAWEGAVALATNEHEGCVVSHRFPVIRGKSDKVLTEYIFALLRSRHGDFMLNDCSRGSAGRNKPLNMGLLLKWKIPVPSIEYQQRIATLVWLRDRLKQKNERSIDLLKERRAALITAAVTGQIDLREAA